MLSLGEHFKHVPKESLANMQFRKRLLELARSDPGFGKHLRKCCANDILFFINAFVVQYNGKDRTRGEVGPFITWDFQDEAARTMLACVRDGRDLIIEKSRDMGASWLCLLIVLWIWLFHPHKTLLVVSKSEKAVEDDNPEALFWKLDFILGYLPSFLKAGYTEKLHRRSMHFLHPNGSTIYGAASTGRAGVGAKCTMMFVDEFSQIKEDFEVYSRTSDTTDCRIFNGTHLGTSTCFFDLTNPETAAGSAIRKLQMHWSQHPEKRKGLYRMGASAIEVLDKQYAYPADFNYVMDGSPTGGPYPGMRSPWYDVQCFRKGNLREIAMDLDINPSGSVSQFFDAIVIRNLVALYAREPMWQGELDVDEYGRPVGITKQAKGRLEFWFLPDPQGNAPAGVYAIGGDISGGTGRTNSCLSVVDAATGEKVAAWVSPHVKAEELAPIAVALCRYFKTQNGEPAKMAWEKKGPGTFFGIKIMEMGFRNVYYRNQDIALPFGETVGTPGWEPTDDAKLALLQDYRAALKTRAFLNHCKTALEETLKFKYSGNGRKVYHSGETDTQDPSGAGVNHGDRVIGDALAWLMAREKFRKAPKKPEDKVPILSLQWRRDLAERRDREEAFAN